MNGMYGQIVMPVVESVKVHGQVQLRLQLYAIPLSFPISKTLAILLLLTWLSQTV